MKRMNREGLQPGPEHKGDTTDKSPLLVQGGLFIVFEGIDGTGKSTQLQLLAERLTRLGYDVVSTREPTDGSYGIKIRELFIDRGTVSREEELALFIADREQHVNEVITPALTKGCIVLCDRYYLSTVAYQGANGMDQALILSRNENFPTPDQAIILEIEPAQGIQRIQNTRNEHPNTFEEEENLQKVAAIFAGMEQDYITRINGAGSIDHVHHLVYEAVVKVLDTKTVEAGKSADDRDNLL